MVDNSKEIITAAVTKMSDAVAYLEEDLKSYRAGKANPAVFNNVMVNYYGNPTPIPQVASVNVPDARTMLIQPWEKSMTPHSRLPLSSSSASKRALPSVTRWDSANLQKSLSHNSEPLSTWWTRPSLKLLPKGWNS